jgi:uncharacterized protein
MTTSVRVAVTGSSGFVGRALLRALQERGDDVTRVSRGSDGDLEWNPMSGFEPSDALSGIDAVVHLAGENVGRRWTAARMQAIRDSRVIGTKTLVDALHAADPRPRVLISASGVGYYGARGDERLDESAPPGDDFLARVCRDWEAAAFRASAHGVRTVVLRLGLVLGHGGGPLARMVPIFRMGVGGRLGSGAQWMSWIHIDDLVRAILLALDDPTLTGPYNTTAPEPVTNEAFTRSLARALRRPAVIPVPGLALRAVFGAMAGTLLTGQRAVPSKLAAAGFRFRHERLDGALGELFASP